ncbi:MAG: Methanogen marker protein 4 [archaeon GW2011_AR5]|nr:MAG: Methanogen marker protein 4 [archaeon GW2011_AR5]
MASGNFTQRVEELAALHKPRIAFGLTEPDTEILASLIRSKKYADIVLVGPQAIAGIADFETVIDENPEEKISSMLAADEVEGIVRGTIDDFKTYEAYERLTGEKYTIDPAFMEDPKGRQFFLGPASNPQGWGKEERLFIAAQTAAFVKEWNLEPRIAIYTGVRHDTYERKKDIRDGVEGILNKTYEDAEWIVAELQKKGYHAKNWAIDLNPAVEEGYNIHIAVNGMVGNQIFRAVLFCGGKVLAATRFGLSRPYEDNSRTERDFDFHIKWLVALINQKRFSR